MSPAGAAASLARHLGALAAGLQAASDAVPHEVGFWSAPGQVLLLDMLGGSADRIGRTAQVCAVVARALTAHAEDLARAELIRRRATPDDAERAHLEAAALVRASGERLRATVGPATRDLPEPVHGPAAVRSGLQGTAGSFLLGALQAVTAPLSAVRWAAEIPTDPGGHATEARQGLAAAGDAATDPHAWLSLLDLETLRDDPARWAGGMTPTALGALGGGAVARQVFARQLAERQARAQVRGELHTGLERLLVGSRSTESRRLLVGRAANRTTPGDVPWSGEGRRLDTRQLAATDRLRDLSALQASRLTSAMEDVAGETGLTLRGLETNVKGADSLRRKAADKVRFAHRDGRTLAEALGEINDIVRFTFQASDADYTARVRQVSKIMEEKGFHLGKAWNAWAADDVGYRGVNTTWTMPDTGVRFEVQFHTAASHRAGVVTHPLYERQRVIRRGSREWDRLDRRIRAAYAEVPMPAGIDDLPLHDFRPAATPARFDRPPDLRVPAAAGAGAGGAAATSGGTEPP